MKINVIISTICQKAFQKKFETIIVDYYPEDRKYKILDFGK